MSMQGVQGITCHMPNTPSNQSRGLFGASCCSSLPCPEQAPFCRKLCCFVLCCCAVLLCCAAVCPMRAGDAE